MPYDLSELYIVSHNSISLSQHLSVDKYKVHTFPGFLPWLATCVRLP